MQGPTGLFAPGDNSYIKCVGKTATSCQEFQTLCSAIKPTCNSIDNYQCVFVVKYGDDSKFAGLVVNESITVALEDKSEREMFGLFGYFI